MNFELQCEFIMSNIMKLPFRIDLQEICRGGFRGGGDVACALPRAINIIEITMIPALIPD